MENNNKGGLGLLVAVLLLLIPGSWALQLRSGAAKPADTSSDSSGKEAEKADAAGPSTAEPPPAKPAVSDVSRLLFEYCGGPSTQPAASSKADAKAAQSEGESAGTRATTPAPQASAATPPVPDAPAPTPPVPATSATLAPEAGAAQDTAGREPWTLNNSFCRSQDGTPAVQASVALVPERGWGLDGAIESLIRAHETAGYVLVQHVLPDRSAEEKPAAKPWLGGLLFHRLPSADPAKSPTAGRDWAGVQLVYLVLESATKGVDAAALQSVMAELAELPSVTLPLLRVLGPTFSGSARRLGWLLGKNLQELSSLRGLRLKVVSGTATDDSLGGQVCAGFLMVQTHAACSDGTGDQQATPQLAVHSMVQSDSAMLRGLWRFLRCELHAIPQQIAIVSESSTFYGQEILRDGPPTTAKDSAPFAGAMVLPMPSGLSHLRAEWARQGRTEAAPTNNRDPARALDPISGDSGRRGSLHLYERNTINTRDLSLAALLTSICQEGIRYVGLFLTDPADKEFLAQRIALQCPDVRLFTMESELDYLHSKHYSYMRGTLVSSTYPLYSRNTQWSTHKNTEESSRAMLHRLQFARQADQGLYNATLYSIDRPDLMQEYAPPRFVKKSSGDLSTRPPVWISAVGREGLLPLRAYDDAPSPPATADDCCQAAQAGPEQNPPWITDWWQKPGKYAPYDLGAARLTLLLLAIMAFIHSWAFFRNQYGQPTLVSLPHERPRFFDFMVPWTPPGTSRPARPSVNYLFLFGPIWAALTFLTLVLALRFRSQNQDTLLSKSFWEDLGYSLTGVVAMTSMGLALVDVVMRRFAQKPVLSLWQRLASRIARSTPVTMSAFLIPSILVGAGIYVFNSWLAHRPAWVLFLRRSSQTDYELSLLVPTVFLALVGYGWGLSSLRRQQYFDRRRPVTPAGMAPPDANGPKVGGPVWELSWWIWGAILAGTTVAMIPILRRLSTIDHWVLDVVFALSLWAVAVAAIGSLVRVASTWHRLRQQIFWATHHPISAVLKTLPSTLMEPLRSLLTTTLSPYTEQALIAKQCQLVEQAYADMSDAERTAWVSLLPAGAEPPWQRMLQGYASVAVPVQPAQKGEPRNLHRPPEPPLTPDHQLAKLLVAATIWPPGNTPVLATADSDRAGQAEPKGAACFYRRVQELLALRLVVYLFHLVTPLRETMLFVSASLILTLLALNSYPFHPARSLGTFTWLLLSAGVALLGLVLLQMRRDPILSGLAADDAGKLTWNTGLSRQFSLVIVAPILTMLATKIPALSWLASLLQQSGN